MSEIVTFELTTPWAAVPAPADPAPRPAPASVARASTSVALTRRGKRFLLRVRLLWSAGYRSRLDGRALPRAEPRALQAAAELRAARRVRPRVRGHEPVLRR